MRGLGINMGRGGGGGGGVETDPYFANVTYLSGFEGTDGQTTFTDESLSANTVTRGGDAQIDTAQFKFGASSVLFDGTGDYLTIGTAADADFTFGANPFTIEGWFRWNSFAGLQTLYSNFSGIGFLGMILQNSGASELTLGFSDNGGSSLNQIVITSGAGLGTGAWFHIAVSRSSGNKVRVRVGGVMVASITGVGTIYQATEAVRIGADGNASWPFNGWMDEYRITKGVDRYDTDSNITVRTAAFPRA